MSESAESAAPVPASPTAATGAPTDPKAAGGAPGYNAGTTVSSMADLEAKAPDLAKAMKEGIAMQITQQMKRHGERMKEIMRRGRYGG